jgi:hypothetical protein
MSTESSKETTTHQETNPWGPQAGALTKAFDAAGNALTGAQGAVAPTDFVSQMSPEAIAAFRQMVSQGSNLGIPDSQAGTAAAMTGAGAGGVAGALSGLAGYNPAATNNTGSNIDAAKAYAAGMDIPGAVRAAMQSGVETARDITMPGIEMNAANTGNTNSTRTGVAQGIVGRGLAEQAGNLAATLSNSAYAKGLDTATSVASDNNAKTLGALSTRGSIGNTATATGLDAGNSSVQNQGALTSEAAAGGAGLTAAQQAILDNQYQQYQSKVSSGFDPIKQYMSIVGTNNWGGTTDGTATETKKPSAWDTISGLMSAGGSLATGAAGMGLKFSDRRVKEDIKRVGTLDNGLPVYTYRYVGSSIVQMGLMAQDVELVNPGAVGEIHGIKAVDYEKACA